MKLSDLGEDRLLRLLLKGVPGGKGLVLGAGDDCAVARMPKGGHLLLKTDCVVEDIHFRRSDEPARVGWKALCRPLSDLAAMGGEPRHALITIVTPSDVPVDYWKEFYRGLRRAARRFHVGIAGGETARSPAGIMVSIALTGWVAARFLTRGGGSPGDVLFVTGRLGGSLAGHHLDFVPRLAEGRWLAKSGCARAMMDLSDGLAHDLPRLAGASGCGFVLDRAAVPKNRGCSLEQALTDGEDYELLLAVASRRAAALERAWRARFPRVPLARIGRLTPPGPRPEGLPAGFDHFFGCQKPPKPPR